MPNMVQRIAELQASGRPVAVATVTWRRAPSSGKVGSRALIHPDGTVEGWMGGACSQPTLVREALEALAEGTPRLVVLGERDDRPGVVQVPMACSSEGALEVYVEPVLPAPHVHVVGASPMTSILAEMAGALGWRVTTSDTDDMTGVDERTFVVVATQGHHDEPAVAAALHRGAGYVGLVASQKRAANVLAWLAEQGAADEDLARVRAPAGMDLGPTLHEEMSVAILAELVALRAERGVSTRTEVTMPEQVIDPVCHMVVDPATAAWTSEHQGTSYYFCAPGCKKAFDADPESFLG